MSDFNKIYKFGYFKVIIQAIAASRPSNAIYRFIYYCLMEDQYFKHADLKASGCALEYPVISML